MPPDADEFFDRLRLLNQQARNILTADLEVLQEFVSTTESFALAHSAPTAENRAAQATQHIWTTTPGPTQIIWAEWIWKT